MARVQVGQNVEALLVGIANGWRPMLSIRLASPRPSEGADASGKPAPSGGFDAREERDLRVELGDMPQVHQARRDQPAWRGPPEQH